MGRLRRTSNFIEIKGIFSPCGLGAFYFFFCLVCQSCRFLASISTSFFCIMWLMIAGGALSFIIALFALCQSFSCLAGVSAR